MLAILLHPILTGQFVNDKLAAGVLAPVSARPVATDAKGIKGSMYALKNKDFVKKKEFGSGTSHLNN